MRPKTDGGIVYKQTLISAEFHIGKRGQETELTKKSVKEAKVRIGM